MKKEEFIPKVNDALAQEFEVEIEEITPDADIKETLDLDSLSLVDMVAIIEDMFEVSIKNQEIAQVKTFNDLYDFIEGKINE
ncbi:phosphopantetheine-binding protein [Bacteroidales bacterium OttesenSCG-928-B11]|nr:phosphopantetheine-binding protein [Bacteroidales bacterium OttesenSCG-928-C03]MDL2311701.1 phosphopantetheine-binding protein [Bacteroidales bacterium OttesenSCG-928-B11]MDL2325894.1 phosphopantetheine-binding protein [Bacteroidales bacterium OttesenSCG-928-A14]